MRFQYCPTCGTKAIMKVIGDEGEMPYCPQCEVPLWDLFPVSIICTVLNEYGEVALLRQDYVSKTNYVCVAGFIKAGETAEEAVTREVFEEIGQTVVKLDYVRSYYYEKKDMMMLGFLARVKKAEFITSGEVDSVEWFPMSEALEKLRVGGIAWQLVAEIGNRVAGVLVDHNAGALALEDYHKITYLNADGTNPDFVQLSNFLETYLNQMVGGAEKRQAYKSLNALEGIQEVLLAYEGEQAIGCACLKPYSEDAVMLKRVFVRPEYRGHHISTELLTRLEVRAKELGYKQMLLQTRAECIVAVKLYESLGYEQVPNFPPYEGMSEALCYRKVL